MFNIEPFLNRHGIKLFWAFMITGVIPIFFYETEFNAPYFFAFKYASAPIIVICYFIAFNYMPNWKNRSNTKIKLFIPLLSAAFIVLFMGGHVLAFNSLIGSQKKIMITGDIIDMNIRSGRSSTEYLLSITIDNTNKIKKLETSSYEFKRYKIGDKYQKMWFKGSLGFIYRKK